MRPVTEYRIDGQRISVAAYVDTLTFEGPIINPKTLKPFTRWERTKIAFQWIVYSGMIVEMYAFFAHESEKPHPTLVVERMRFNLRRPKR